MTQSVDELLQAEALSVQAGACTLVQQLDLTLRRGEFWCLLGPNGTGKTLLMQTLAGARAPTRGAVRVVGRTLTEQPPQALACWRGFLPQQVHDAFGAPVLDVVLQGRHPHLSRWAWEGAEDRALAEQALARVGLSGFAQRDVTTLSGGERQRVALATLLVQDPPLMLLDEPLAHLDLAHEQDVATLLADEVRTRGRAVLMSVHDLSLAQRVATHVLLLGGDGGAAWAGPVDEVMQADRLSTVFGHRLHRVDALGQVWWLPA